MEPENAFGKEEETHLETNHQFWGCIFSTSGVYIIDFKCLIIAFVG